MYAVGIVPFSKKAVLVKFRPVLKAPTSTRDALLVLLSESVAVMTQVLTVTLSTKETPKVFLKVHIKLHLKYV